MMSLLLIQKEMHLLLLLLLFGPIMPIVLPKDPLPVWFEYRRIRTLIFAQRLHAVYLVTIQNANFDTTFPKNVLYHSAISSKRMACAFGTIVPFNMSRSAPLPKAVLTLSLSDTVKFQVVNLSIFDINKKDSTLRINL